MFVWHTGEEAGLTDRATWRITQRCRSSRVAQLNIDMVGRNRGDDPKESNTVYLVGSDRISTELHNLSEDSNASMSDSLKLNYEMNDPPTPNRFIRSY